MNELGFPGKLKTRREQELEASLAACEARLERYCEIAARRCAQEVLALESA